MIEVEHVSKRFGAVEAVRDVSFRVAAGEVVGFLGPNGAGKTTVLRMLSTYLQPDSGCVRVAGFDTREAPLAVREKLGFLAEHNALYEGMRVRDWLRFVARARGLSAARLAEREGWVIEHCQLAEVLERRIAACSKGFRQRIGLAAALVHDPPAIALDEPTHGLDPLQVAAFRGFVRSLATGRAILFSSHIVSEVASISDRILFLHRGRTLVDERVDALLRTAQRSGRDLEQELFARVRALEGGAA